MQPATPVAFVVPFVTENVLADFATDRGAVKAATTSLTVIVPREMVQTPSEFGPQSWLE